MATKTPIPSPSIPLPTTRTQYAGNHFTYGELEENEVELVKLRNWYEKVQTRDAYGAPKRSEASQALDACSDALELYAARVYDEEDEGR
jgi:hypothetical protein